MSGKPPLPPGWIVKQSKSHPDRVYYFNVNSGVSTWELPDIFPQDKHALRPPVNIPQNGPQHRGAAGRTEAKFSPEPAFSDDDSGEEGHGTQRGNSFRRTPNSSSRTGFQRGNQNNPTHGHMTRQTQGLLPHSPLSVNPQPVPRSSLFPLSQPSPHGLSTHGEGLWLSHGPGMSPNSLLRRTSVDLPHNKSKGVMTNQKLQYEIRPHASVGVASGLGSQISSEKLSPGINPVGKTGIESLGGSQPSSQRFAHGMTQDKTGVGSNHGSQHSSQRQQIKSPDKSGASSALSFQQLSPLVSPLQQTVGSGHGSQQSSHGPLPNKTSSSKGPPPPNSGRSATSVGSVHSSASHRSLTNEIKPEATNFVHTPLKTLNTQPTVNASSSHAKSDNNNLRNKTFDKLENLKMHYRPHSASSDPRKRSNVGEFCRKRLHDSVDGGCESATTSDSKDTRVVQRSEGDNEICKKMKIINEKTSPEATTEVNDRRIVSSLEVSLGQDGERQVSQSKSSKIKKKRDKKKANKQQSAKAVDVEHLVNETVKSTGSGANEGPQTHGHSESSSTENTLLKDPEKLQVIQSWVNQIRPETDSLHNQSVSECGEFGEDKRLVLANDTVDDSGYSTNTTSSAFKPVRGWPAPAAIHTDVTAREISEMEVDITDLPESDSPREEEDMIVDMMLEVRGNLQNSPGEVIGPLTEFFSKTDSQPSTLIHQNLYVVVDTNVFMDHLAFLDELKDTSLDGYGKPTLVVAWIVLQELDTLKDGNKKSGITVLSLVTQKKARMPVNFLNNCFKSRHPRVMAQTPKEASEAAESFQAECNDDRIIQCCLQCQQKYHESDIVLLSNDKNLCSKALVCGVEAFSRDEFVPGVYNRVRKKLKRPVKSPIIAAPASTSTTVSPNVPNTIPSNEQSLPQELSPLGPQGQTTCAIQSPVKDDPEQSAKLTDDVFCKMKSLLRNSLGKVLEVEMKLAYGDIWLEIVKRKPPWSLCDVLDCLKRHWIAVFGQFLTRNLENKIIPNLLTAFTPGNGYTVNMEKLEEILVDSISVLQSCEVHSKYEGVVPGTLHQLKILYGLVSDCLDNNICPDSVDSLDVYLQNHFDKQVHVAIPKQPRAPSIGKRSDLPSPTTASEVGILPVDPTSSSAHIKSSAQPFDKPTMSSVRPLSVQQTTSSSLSSTKLSTQSVQPTASSPNVNTKPLAQSVQTAGLAGKNHSSSESSLNGQGMEVAKQKFQNVWTFVEQICCNLSNVQPEQEAISIVQVVVPLVSDLRMRYSALIEVAPSRAKENLEIVSKLKDSINSFFQQIPGSEDKLEPVTNDQLIQLFQNTKNRPGLMEALNVLDGMLLVFYNWLNNLS